MNHRERPVLVAVILYEGVEPIDVGGTVGVISMASRTLPGIRATTIAERAGPVRCAGGLVVQADHGFDDAPAADAFIVTGGPGWRREAANAAMIAFLQKIDPARLGSVCTGALILAGAGCLAGRAATTRRRAVGAEAQAPLDLLAEAGVRTRAVQVVDDGDGPWTSGGVALAVDGTLHLIGKLYDEGASDEVARSIEYDRAWSANRIALVP